MKPTTKTDSKFLLEYRELDFVCHTNARKRYLKSGRSRNLRRNFKQTLKGKKS